MNTSPPDRRRTRQEQHRKDLLDAATRYIFEHGLSSLSIRPLAEALGISHRTLLYHFGSKERLVVEVLQEIRARDRAFFLSLVHEKEPISTAELGWKFWQRFTASNYERYFRIFFEIYGLALQNPEIYEGFLQGVITDWLPIFEERLIAEGYARDTARSMATLLFAAARGLHLDLLTTRDAERVNAAAELLGQLFERRSWPTP